MDNYRMVWGKIQWKRGGKVSLSS